MSHLLRHGSKGSRLWAWVVICLSLLSCAIVILLALLQPSRTTGDIIAVCGLVAFLGSLALLLWLTMGWPSAPRMTAAYLCIRSGFHVRGRFVPWSAVATCEIHTCYDAFGRSSHVLFVLKDRDGRDLMIPNLLGTTFEDQERLARFIRAKLPKAKDDLLE